MKVGLYDVDSKGYPNLPLMKISAYHKQRGDSVEFINWLEHYDIVYASKIFGDEYSQIEPYFINADKVIWGGSGLCIKVVDGKEVFEQSQNNSLPYEVEHIYPDYGLYPNTTKDKAIGFLTRGCPNNCDFCIVSKKEGRKSVKVADLSEWWRGQKQIDLLDANLLACKDHMELLEQLNQSKAKINFMQGLDARFVTEEVALKLNEMKSRIKTVHFAFDFMKNEKSILKGLKTFKDITNIDDRKASVYILTNFNTTLSEDIYRVKKVIELGFVPDVRIYRKNTAPKYLRDLQGWANNKIKMRSCNLEDYVPRKDGKTFRELYLKGVKHEQIY